MITDKFHALRLLPPTVSIHPPPGKARAQAPAGDDPSDVESEIDQVAPLPPGDSPTHEDVDFSKVTVKEAFSILQVSTW
jgi:hypothetical protein